MNIIQVSVDCAKVKTCHTAWMKPTSGFLN
jgi:hypothetical protein